MCNLDTKQDCREETKPCVDCNTPIDADVWEEELGMCLNCSDKFWSHEGEED